LVRVGRDAIAEIGQQLLHNKHDRRFRLRLIHLLRDIGQDHREAMVPLLQLLATTSVPLLFHVPEPDSMVGTSGSQRLAIRAEGNGKDIVLVARQGGTLLAGSHIPQLHRPVVKTR
jgi:hypothetical protein